MQANLQPQTDRLKPFLLFFAKKQWLYFLLIQLFALAWAGDRLLWPYFTKYIIDALSAYQVSDPDIFAKLAHIIVIGVVIWCFLAGCFRSSWFLGAKAYPKMEAQIRLWMFDYVQKHSHTYFANQFAGNLSNKINDMARSSTMIMRYFIHMIIPACLSFLLAFVLFMLKFPIFAALFAVWIAIEFVIIFSLAKKCNEYAWDHSEERSKLTGKVVDSLSNHMNVRLFSRNAYEYNHILQTQREEFRKNQKVFTFVEIVKLLLDFTALIFFIIGMHAVVFYAWYVEMIGVSDVVLVLQMSWSLLFVVWIFCMELPELYREIGVCNQALTILQIPHEIKDRKEASELKVTRGDIQFENVHFEYVKGQNLFDGSNLHILPGQKVGLVGFSGSGKSTFVNLILRFFDIQEGKITLDGQDISEVTQESLRSQISMIPQDTSLFHRSLLENIKYGNLEATEEDVIKAAKQANCDEFIQELDEKYHTLVGERGIKLSGGQRQRIAIARAILKDAPILILDEATSALDTVTEKLIQKSLKTLMEGKTTLIIAHRLSTLLDMDRILVFKDGCIIEDGSHEELLKNEDHYAHLWKMQTGGQLSEDLL